MRVVIAGAGTAGCVLAARLSADPGIEVVLLESGLSFLGLGTQPPTPSLGLMLSEGRNFLMLAPWPAVFSGVAILLLAFGLNLLGDALRDTLDPRLRGGH